MTLGDLIDAVDARVRLAIYLAVHDKAGRRATLDRLIRGAWWPILIVVAGVVIHARTRGRVQPPTSLAEPRAVGRRG